MLLFKRCIALLLSLCLLFLSACTSVGTPAAAYTTPPQDLGIPGATYYTYNLVAQCVWDMAIYEDKLYVGCGNYVENTGGVPVLYCDLNDLGNWKQEALLPDEQIGRFVMLDDKLTIPGWDPVDSPLYGTYYQLTDGQWQTYSGLPDGFHNFDLVRYDGKLFAAIGARRGQVPIAVSEDGKTFERVTMLRNGEEIDTFGGECIRSHNFWVLNDTLYAGFYYENMVEKTWTAEVYRYEKGEFVCCADLGKSINMNGMGTQNLGNPWADAVIDDVLFFTTGRLYMTTDMVEFTEIQLPNYTFVYDIYMHDDVMYLLGASSSVADTTTGAMQYHITVYSAASADPYEFKAEFTYDHAQQPTALAVNDNGCFVAFGNWHTGKGNLNGQVLYFAKE